MSPLDKTVLVVEDNAGNMRLFHDVFEVHGYNVLQAKDGMEGWDLAREHHPDLILMDIQLPYVSGLEVTKWLKNDEDLKQIPVIAITGIDFRVSLAFSHLVTSRPETPGNRMSMRIRSGRCSRAMRQPSIPSLACRTL